MTDDPLALDRRDGLPEALRLLLADYPREAWEADPGFHGLVSFWLDRHMGFRRVLGLLQDEARAVTDRRIDPATYAPRLSRLGGALVAELQGHHQIEDHHYFPALQAAEPRIARGFDLLDADHHALDGLLAEFVEGANGVLSRHGDDAALREAAAGFRPGIARLHRLIERHLTDEEDLIVPVLLARGGTL